MLFVGLVSPCDTPVEDGNTYSFWSGGHIVYFMAVLLANLVLLRATHNWTGWGEAIVLLQLVSYFVFTYADSKILDTGVIAHFYDEFMSSKTAWLGVLLVGSLIFIEKACLDMAQLLKEYRDTRGHSQTQIMASDRLKKDNLLYESGDV